MKIHVLDGPEYFLICEQLEAHIGSGFGKFAEYPNNQCGVGNMGMWTLQFGNITKQQCRLWKQDTSTWQNSQSKG
jgi:hypothetical protein